MQGTKWTILIIVSLLLGNVICSDDLELKKNVGAYEIAIKIDRNPPILGNNRIEIEIKESGGALVTDADVLVNYYMPPMPRMVPMNYKVKAKLKGGTYTAVMKFIMEGPWVIAVKVSHGDRKFTAKFNINAR